MELAGVGQDTWASPPAGTARNPCLTLHHKTGVFTPELETQGEAELGRGHTRYTWYHHLQDLLPTPILASNLRLIMRLCLELGIAVGQA